MDDSLTVQVKVENIALNNLGFVIFLKEEGASTVLPIFIGAPEAHSIAAAYTNHKFPRPLSHDLFKNMLQLLDCTITRIIITDLVESTFYAKIYLKNEKENFQIDSRPSDAIALALRFKAPIFISKAVLEIASINIDNQTPKIKDQQVDTVGQLKSELEQAVTEERYEDAAKIRDELKKLQNDN